MALAPLDISIVALRQRVAGWRRAGDTVALVPTMGALHAGHLALVREARRLADRIVLSIFVNPTQFAAGEDFSNYPRDLDGDLAKLNQTVDAVFAPAADEILPDGFATTINVGGPSAGLESAFRPHFFAGVATIVTKLLLVAAPDIAVFGEKDYQQLLVIRRLVRDLAIPVEIATCPTVREPDGLALSSRNRSLSSTERLVAPVLQEALFTVAATIRASGSAEAAIEKARQTLTYRGFEIDYLELRNSTTLAPARENRREPLRILAAVRLGNTRLIDNIAVEDTS